MTILRVIGQVFNFEEHAKSPAVNRSAAKESSTGYWRTSPLLFLFWPGIDFRLLKGLQITSADHPARARIVAHPTQACAFDGHDPASIPRFYVSHSPCSNIRPTAVCLVGNTATLTRHGHENDLAARAHSTVLLGPSIAFK